MALKRKKKKREKKKMNINKLLIRAAA